MTPDDYMRQIVEPAIQDLVADPASQRHAFVACVVTFHAIDYLVGTRRKVVVRGEFRTQSAAFAAVDRIAHGGFRAAPEEARRPAPDVLGLVRAAADFLRGQIRAPDASDERPAGDTYFVVVPFDRSAEGDIAAGTPEEVMNAAAAEKRARVLARQHAGAIAFSRSGDPATGEFQDAVILAQFGDVGPNGLGG